MTTFSLLTLNCFGVPAPATRQRLLTLARELDRRAVSVACLQEVQAHAFRRMLTAACTRYPEAAFEPFSYAPKGGLLTLAQQPFAERQFTIYRERGLWYTPALADWMLHKGVLSTHTLLDGVRIVVLNTHLSANYRGNWDADNQYVRTERSQLRQLAEIVAAQPSDAIVVAAGDFNIPRGSRLYEEFLAASGMTDPLAGDRRPTFRTPPGVPARYMLPIDYALVRAPPLPGLKIRSDICFNERIQLIGGRQAYLSDHFGIELEIAWGHP